MASGTLYGFSGSFRTQKILIAAQYSGARVVLESNFKPGITEHSKEFLKKFPFGKAPAFETQNGHRLFESNAIASYVGGTLSGSDATAAAEVQQWMNFAEVNICPLVAGWVYPSLSVMQFNKQSVDQSRDQLLKLLGVLDEYLLTRTYLVGERITLADVVVSVHILLAYQHVIEKSTREHLVNVTRWFETMMNQPEFKAVLGEVKLCDKAANFDAKKFKDLQAQSGHHAHHPTPAVHETHGDKNVARTKQVSVSSELSADGDLNESVGEGGSKKKKKGKKDKSKEKDEPTPTAEKKEKAKDTPKPKEDVNGAAEAAEELDAADEALALEPKSKDPFDGFPKSSFNLEEFKRVYSNNDTLTVALPYFWTNFDKQNYSIWYCEYKYPKELTMVFMSCNLITGMFQRLDKMRKNAFGSMILFGSDNNSTISGLWTWRCQDLAFPMSADWQIDYESYTWKKLDPDSEETKTMIKEYFAWEGNFNGKKFNQGKIFK